MGLPHRIMVEALERAKTARMQILDTMNKVISTPRETLSKYAPKLITMEIDPEFIGKVIGPAGKMIKSLQEQTGTTIEIEEDGTVYISCVGGTGHLEAKAMIEEAGTRLSRLSTTWRPSAPVAPVAPSDSCIIAGTMVVRMTVTATHFPFISSRKNPITPRIACSGPIQKGVVKNEWDMSDTGMMANFSASRSRAYRLYTRCPTETRTLPTAKTNADQMMTYTNWWLTKRFW